MKERAKHPHSLLPARVGRGMVALGIALCAAPALSSTPLQPHDVQAAVPQIEAQVRKTMRAWQVPGLAIGIVSDDKLVYAKGFGVRRHGASEPVDADTVFQMGSTTKAFLGVTQALLVDQGKLQWTDKVVDHFPAFRLADPWATAEFEIADLLAQRSGLPPYALTDMSLYGYPREDVIRALRYVEPATSFRSTFAYQNAFHMVSGAVLAHASGHDSWESLLDRQLLQPLGMTSTTYTAQAMAAMPNRSDGHRHDHRTITVDPLAPFPYNAGGAGNLNSNVTDVSRWLRFQINQGEIDGKRILSSEVLRQTHQPRIAISGAMVPIMALSKEDELAYATGWIVHSTPQGRVIEHGGGTSGFTTHVAFDPDRRFGVVVLSNLSTDIGNGAALPLGKYVLDLFQGRPAVDHAAPMLAALRSAAAARDARFKPPADAVPTAPLSSYTGAYRSPTLGAITLRLDDEGRLAFTLGPKAVAVTLEPWSGDVFISRAQLPADGPNAYVERKKLVFQRNALGAIEGFDWSDDGDGAGQPPFRREPPRADSG